MVTLTNGVRRRREVDVATKVVFDTTKAVMKALNFRIQEVEVWKNQTSISLGGEKVQTWVPPDEGEIFPFNSLINNLLKSNILLLKGEIEKPSKHKVEIEYNIWSGARKMYSDILIDTAPSEHDTIVDLLWTNDGQVLTIELIKQMAKIRTEIEGRKRRTIHEVIISPEINDSDDFSPEDYIGFYSSKAKPYVLLKRMITGAVKNPEGEKNIASKLSLLNIDKFSKKVYDISAVKRRFEVIDERVARMPLGSIFFMAKDKGSFSSFATDIKEMIVMPSLEPLQYEDELIKRIEEKLERHGVRTFDEEN